MTSVTFPDHHILIDNNIIDIKGIQEEKIGWLTKSFPPSHKLLEASCAQETRGYNLHVRLAC
jgi:hypothetical protein